MIFEKSHYDNRLSLMIIDIINDSCDLTFHILNLISKVASLNEGESCF